MTDVVEFDLRDVLTVTTGYILSGNDYSPFVNIMNYLRGGTDMSLMETLPWVEKAREDLFRQHPWLEDFKFPREELGEHCSDEVRDQFVNDWMAFAYVIAERTSLEIMPMDDGILVPA